MKIFVGNLNESTTEDQIRALFEQFGQVTECDIIKNFGFVHMAVEEEGHAAVAALHGYDINGTKMNVEQSTGNSGGRRGGGKRGGGAPFRGGRGGRGGRSGFERDRAQPYPSGREQRGRGRGSFSSGLGGPPHPPDVDRESMRDMYREIYREAYLQAYRDLYRDIASRDAARDARQSLSQEIPSTSRESGGDPYRRPPPEYYDRYHNL